MLAHSSTELHTIALPFDWNADHSLKRRPNGGGAHGTNMFVVTVFSEKTSPVIELEVNDVIFFVA